VSVWSTIPKRGGAGLIRLRVRRAKRVEMEVRVGGVSVTIEMSPSDCRRLQGALGTACATQAALQCDPWPDANPTAPPRP
jgi:hypothetical protein